MSLFEPLRVQRDSRFLLSASLLLSSLLLVVPAVGEVVFFDGFGDADLNNNQRPFDDFDVLSDYEPPEFPGTTVAGVTSVLDPSDTGLRWLFANGFTPTNDAKATPAIVDDSAGIFPETASGLIPALDTGYALSYNSRGRGSSVIGFFDQSIELGPEVGDQVKVGFDFRTWASSPNSNTFTPPEIAELRFGLFQDTDQQLGQVNPLAGPLVFDENGDPVADPVTGNQQVEPAIWGQDGGLFRGALVDGPGANGDSGWYTRIELGDPNSPFGPPADGSGARINEENNLSLGDGDTSTPRFLEGADNDFVASPASAGTEFVSLDSTEKYRLELTLERATDTDAGDTIRAIYDVTDLTSGETWQLVGQEALTTTDADGNEVPDGINSDSWDYFGLRNTGADDFDLIIDNFQLEIFGSNAGGTSIDLNDDGSVDCADVDGLVAAIVGGSTDEMYDVNTDGVVDTADLEQWLVDAGTEQVGGAFLDGDANLDGVVDVSDFNIWNSNQFTNTPAWCSGDFTADGVVDVSDFNIWNSNQFRSSDHVSAVPEPSSTALLLGGLLGLLAMVRKNR